MARLGSVAALAMVTALAGCASGLDTGPDGVIVQRQELLRLRASVDKLARLEREIVDLRLAHHGLDNRLKRVESKGSSRAPVRKELHRVSGQSARFTDATLIAGAGAGSQRKSLRQAMAGKRGMVVSYWATWCVPCISDEELASLRTLERELGAHRVSLVSMAIDDLGKVRAHPKAPRWFYPLWHQTDGHIEMLPKSFISRVGLNLPLFVVVDSDGSIVAYRDRKLSPAGIAALVDVAAAL